MPCMGVLSKTLKALALILSLILSLGSTLIALDAQSLAKQGIRIIDQNSYTTSETAVIEVAIQVENTGFFFELYDVNVTLSIFDNNNVTYDVDSGYIEYLSLGESEILNLTLEIPIDVAAEWNAGNIELYVRVFFYLWFGKYNYKLLGFGIAGIINLRGE